MPSRIIFLAENEAPVFKALKHALPLVKQIFEPILVKYFQAEFSGLGQFTARILTHHHMGHFAIHS